MKKVIQWWRSYVENIDKKVVAIINTLITKTKSKKKISKKSLSKKINSKKSKSKMTVG